MNTYDRLYEYSQMIKVLSIYDKLCIYSQMGAVLSQFGDIKFNDNLWFSEYFSKTIFQFTT